MKQKLFKWIGKIMKISKFVVKNIATWLNSNSIGFESRKVVKESFDKDLMGFNKTCKVCSRNV
jgi:hypothetical protein